MKYRSDSHRKPVFSFCVTKSLDEIGASHARVSEIGEGNKQKDPFKISVIILFLLYFRHGRFSHD